MLAVRTGLPDVVRLILEAGAEPNVREEYPFRTPLHHAVSIGVSEVVDMLLEKGADPNGLYRGGEASLPILIAAIEDRTTILLLLLEYGANPNYSDNGYLDEAERYTMRTPLGLGTS